MVSGQPGFSILYCANVARTTIVATFAAYASP